MEFEELEYEPLISVDEYLAAGIHIGTQQKTKEMKRFIYRVRTDGLYILDIKSTDERIKLAAKLLSRYEPANILAVASRQYGQHPATQFAKAVGGKAMVGRFVPGSLTNPNIVTYVEPDIIVVTDPIVDNQVVIEGSQNGIPVIGLCDTNNLTSNIDLVIPTNNKGRMALALIYWLLSREVLKERNEPFRYELDHFEAEF